MIHTDRHYQLNDCHKCKLERISALESENAALKVSLKDAALKSFLWGIMDAETAHSSEEFERLEVENAALKAQYAASEEINIGLRMEIKAFKSRLKDADAVIHQYMATGSGLADECARKYKAKYKEEK